MNCLDDKARSRIVNCLIEGCSIRSTARMTGTSKNTIVKLLTDLGCACAQYHNRHVRNLRVRRMQADEIWCFVGAKAKNVRLEKKQEGWGDVWTWVGIDADTKLVVSYLVGGRDGGWAHDFMEDCASRIKNRVQITTDGHRAYLDAVEDAFGADIDYAQLQKLYGTPSEDEQRRYSPARCIGCELKVVSGDPDPAHDLETEPYDANEHEAIHEADECLFKEGGQSPPHGRAALHILQLLQSASNPARDPRDGSKTYGPCLDARRADCAPAQASRFRFQN